MNREERRRRRIPGRRLELPPDSLQFVLPDEPPLIPSICAISAEPLFQVLSVVLYTPSMEEGKSCDVFGNIYTFDSESHIKLFDRSRQNAQTVSLEDNTLTLVGGVIPISKPILHIEIKDKANNAVIVRERLSLPTCQNNSHKFKTASVICDSGSLFVNYLAMCNGVVANLKLVYDDYYPNIYGTINVCHGNTYNDSMWEYSTGCEVFYKTREEAWSMNKGQEIPLSRSLVALPVYSSFKVEGLLFDSDNSVHAAFSIECRPTKFGGPAELVVCLPGGATVNVVVEWYCPFSIKKPSHDSDVLPYLCKVLTLPSGRHVRGKPMLEIFSIFIGSSCKEPLLICGEIKVTPFIDDVRIFLRRNGNPQELPKESRLLTLESPTQLMHCPSTFSMKLDLYDVEDRLIIKGTLLPDNGISEMLSSWFDRCLCSIVNGQNGYAAVHYAVFSRAAQAEVRVTFSPINVGISGNNEIFRRVVELKNVKISGQVVSRYGKLKYPTEYEETCHSSVLFERRGGGARVLEMCPDEGARLPLVKSLVAVPIDSSVIICLNLIMHTDIIGSEPLYIKDAVEFSIGRKNIDTP